METPMVVNGRQWRHQWTSKDINGRKRQREHDIEGFHKKSRNDDYGSQDDDVGRQDQDFGAQGDNFRRQNHDF
eukprot:9189872-Karenia_brevis.AAC.1